MAARTTELGAQAKREGRDLSAEGASGLGSVACWRTVRGKGPDLGEQSRFVLPSTKR